MAFYEATRQLRGPSSVTLADQGDPGSEDETPEPATEEEQGDPGSGYTEPAQTAAPADVLQQGQSSVTAAPQSGLIRITNGADSQLVNPMQQQAQPAQQQLGQGGQYAPPISPEMRAAWPYLNNQQRAAMLQHREQQGAQAWLNQQKLTQAQKIEMAKLEQADAAIDKSDFSPQEKQNLKIQVHTKLDPMKQRLENEQVQQMKRHNQFAADQLRTEAQIKASGNAAATGLYAQTLPRQGVTMTYPDGTTVNGWANKDGEFVPHKETGHTGKGHDIDPAHHTDLATKRLAARKDGEGKALPPASPEEIAKEAEGTMAAEQILRQRAEEDKLPGMRDDKGYRGTIREAAKSASASLSGQKKKQVVDALSELDRLSQVPAKAWTDKEETAMDAANQIAGAYLPAAKAPATAGGQKLGAPPDRDPATVLGGPQPAAAGGQVVETPVQRAARQQEEKADYKAFIEEYARRKGMTVRDAEKFRQRNSPAARAANAAAEADTVAWLKEQQNKKQAVATAAAERRAKVKAQYDAELGGNP